MTLGEVGRRIGFFLSGVLIWQLIGIGVIAVLSLLAGRLLLGWQTVLVAAPMVGFVIALIDLAVTRHRPPSIEDRQTRQGL